jgi:TctA family transporter
VVAFLLDRLAIPIGPIILGLVLGPMVERNFLTSMVIADGRFAGFFERPIAAFLGMIATAVWLLVLSRPWWSRRRASLGG